MKQVVAVVMVAKQKYINVLRCYTSEQHRNNGAVVRTPHVQVGIVGVMSTTSEHKKRKVSVPEASLLRCRAACCCWRAARVPRARGGRPHPWILGPCRRAMQTVALARR